MLGDGMNVVDPEHCARHNRREGKFDGHMCVGAPCEVCWLDRIRSPEKGLGGRRKEKYIGVSSSSCIRIVCVPKKNRSTRNKAHFGAGKQSACLDNAYADHLAIENHFLLRNSLLVIMRPNTTPTLTPR